MLQLCYRWIPPVQMFKAEYQGWHSENSFFESWNQRFQVSNSLWVPRDTVSRIICKFKTCASLSTQSIRGTLMKQAWSLHICNCIFDMQENTWIGLRVLWVCLWTDETKVDLYWPLDGLRVWCRKSRHYLTIMTANPSDVLWWDLKKAVDS